MGKTFRVALVEALETSGISVAELARVTGVSDQQIHKIKQGKSRSTNVDDALTIANFFGKSLDEFLGDPSVRKDAELISLLTQLEPSERQFLTNVVKAQLAARDESHPKPPEGEQ